MDLLGTSKLLQDLGWDSDDSITGDFIEQMRSEDFMEIPIELTDLDLWANYTNDTLYDMDKKLREFFDKTKCRKARKGGYRTTAPAIFKWMFGRAPTPRDGAACRTLHTLLKYYCSSYTGATTYKGKPVPHVYKFGPYTANRKRPYSLRLRLEEAKPGDAVWRANPGTCKDKRTNGRQPDSYPSFETAI